MNNKNQIIIYIICIITFLIIIVSAGSYAYFASQRDATNANFNTLTQTAGATAFTAYSSGAIELDASAERMRDDNISTIAVDKSNATINIKVENDNDSITSICNYDIIWVWDSDDIYTKSSVTLPYTGWDNNIYPFEMSVNLKDNSTGKMARERDLSVLNWNEKNEAIIAHESIIANGKISEKSYTIEVSIYNIPSDQLVFYDKYFQGHIEVRNNNCVSIQSDSEAIYLAEYIKSQYTEDGTGGLYYHDGGGIYDGYPLEAADYSYRYAGAGPYNYVCFEGDNCTKAENLYRIVGVFDGMVKLVTSVKVGDMPWNDGDSNNWTNASLNTYLNNAYLTSLKDKANIIISNAWHIDGIAWADGLGNVENNAKETYRAEMINTKSFSNAKIGLIYVHDYEYAAPPEYWSLQGYSSSGEDYRKSSGNNWLLDTEIMTWTISHNTDVTDRAFRIGIDGAIGRGGDNSMKNAQGVKPAFYLSPIVKYKKGKGTFTNPIVIGI